MIIQVRTRTNFAVLASSAFHHGMLQPGHPVPKKPDFCGGFNLCAYPQQQTKQEIFTISSALVMRIMPGDP
jgi:hypothetical protein